MTLDPKQLADNGRNSKGRPITFQDCATEIEFTGPETLQDMKNAGGWRKGERSGTDGPNPPRSTMGTRD